ncbi:hypothetical protein ACFQHQ_07305 [Zunongwangia atlantica 22II14-10F7]
MAGSSNGSFDYEDRIVIIDRNSEFYGGINNNLKFKNFSLQFLFRFEKKSGLHSLFNAGRASNPLRTVLAKLNGESTFQTISQSSQAGNAFTNVLNTNFPVQDASFIRLQTISFGYDLPKAFLDNIGIDALRLFIHGQNLFTITPYEGIDPQLSLSGIEIGSLRSISGGAQIKF